VNTWVSAMLFIVAVIFFLTRPKGKETPAEVDPEFTSSSTAETEDDEYRGAGNRTQNTYEGEVGTRG